eukprot:2277216-Rhodomonas_salina.2
MKAFSGVGWHARRVYRQYYGVLFAAGPLNAQTSAYGLGMRRRRRLAAPTVRWHSSGFTSTLPVVLTQQRFGSVCVCLSVCAGPRVRHDPEAESADAQHQDAHPRRGRRDAQPGLYLET